ncbi:LytR/AlgR family response regulator transcription factor [Tunturibacter empetritectus]|uniref:Two-component system LytT family response regulator n=1 Tax=Tunturiibacter lichenicola TaxID=2051959 RepID=A0A7W8N257_9BACT|nr:LytTR family DNA-binding domain-containing protein [Edaphobacter lichenicola]MBB5343052.1 two-component system LytT family response regulator [Edaphobacter lichenicola]
MKLKTLIADDEPLARERLRFLLAGDDEVEVVGECRNGGEVLASLRASRVDVLFLDIQMPGRGGFEVIEQVGAAQMPVTVFVTAHDQYALRAFGVHALDYLTKPVEPERLKVALAQAKKRIASNTALLNQERLKQVLAEVETGDTGAKEYPKRLLVPNGTKDTVVNVQEIEWIEAQDYYSCLHVGTKSFMLRETVKQLANTLDPNRFVRIHRSTIVNMDYVREVAREGRSEGSVILTRGQRLKMSKTGWQNLVMASRGP